jgi:hypothetical protein
VNWLNQQCPVQSCDFKACSPSWLCNSEENTVFGVSQITARASQQFTKTYDNAQELLRYINASHVDAMSYRVKSTGHNQTWGLSEKYSQVDALGKKINILNTQSCQTKSYLFTQYSYPKSTRSVDYKPFTAWLKSPHQGERAGAIGAFNGIMADGKFSSAIKFAIKDGLIELAKIKEIGIDNSYQVKYHNGTYTLSNTKEITSTTVSAQCRDIKIVEEKDGLVIYAWLLENEADNKAANNTVRHSDNVNNTGI